MIRQSNQDALLQTILFTGTTFVSAFLMFWVQPLFAKMILPILGGSSAVWTTSMLFFQFTVLAGYIYAHLLGRIAGIKQQIVLHLALLGIALPTLPFAIDYEGITTPEGYPALWVLSFATMTIGLPFFAISASAPLLQRWFSRTGHQDRDNPYFLYAASNLGSMAALFFFPLLFEPMIGVRLQTRYWQAVYVVLLTMFLGTGIVFSRRATDSHGQDAPGAASLPQKTPPIAWNLRLSWLFWAFLPSSMMLGLTSHVTTDLTPATMFWIIPLALYLLSFVVVFSQWQNLLSDKILALIIIVAGLALGGIQATVPAATLSGTGIAIALHLTFFLASAWLLHGCLSRSRPQATHLTEFYLWMATGGMLGGFFNALVAPILFNQIFEYIAVVLAVSFFAIRVLTGRPSGAGDFKRQQTLEMAAVFVCLLIILVVVDVVMSRPITQTVRTTFLAGSLGVVGLVGAAAGYYSRRSTSRRWPLLITLAILLLAIIGNGLVMTQSHPNLFLTRSFYGTMKVRVRTDQHGVPYHFFLHGNTRHNLQRFSEKSQKNPESWSYYHRQTNIGHAMTALQAHLARPLHLGIVGLGAGAIAAYLHEGDVATFYELDPEVVAIATNRDYFTYLAATKGRAAIVVGDARLQLQKAKDHSFDFLAIDAFSSDAIPVHLLTAEALKLYLDKLKEDGVLLLHLSNRYLDLIKMIRGFRLPEGYVLYYASKKNVERPPELAKGSASLFSHSQVALIAKNTSLPEEITAADRWQQQEYSPDYPGWTDDFSNIFRVLRFTPSE